MSKQKKLGIILLIPTFILFIWIIFYLVYGLSLGYVSSVNIIAMMPFVLFVILQIVILIVLVIISVKLIKGKVVFTTKDMTLGTALILAGVLYFLLKLGIVLFNNLTGSNPGGWLQPVIAFFWGSILVIIGFLLKKK